MSTANNALTADAQALEITGLQTLAEDCVYMLPGCGDLMLRKTLQAVFREFCRRTGTLKATDTGTVTYEDPALPLCRDNGEMLVFISAKLGDEVRSPEDCTLSHDCGCLSVTFDLPEDEDDNDGNPVEHAAEATYSYVPRLGSESAPRWFLNKYGDALVAGTLFRLLSMPNQPWSDAATGQLKGIEYQNALNNAVIDRLTGGIKGDLNARASLPFII